jgi:hypothetical protein
MPLDASALDSLSTSLEDLVIRLAELSEDIDEDDEIGIELREVERQLHTASRRLAKATRRSTH